MRNTILIVAIALLLFLFSCTNEPGLQFYGGNFLDGSDTGKYDKKYESRRRVLLCLCV